jgi:hypothetical protein
MLKSDQKDLWIDKDKLKDLWGRSRGNAYIERLKSDDVGAYYVTYFTHLYEEERGEGSVKCYEDAIRRIQANESLHNPESGERMALLKKSKIKGARLHFYPKGLRFYRCSQGIERPVKTESMRAESEEYTNGAISHEVTKEITDDTGKVINIIQTRYYNNKREAKKR